MRSRNSIIKALISMCFPLAQLLICFFITEFFSFLVFHFLNNNSTTTNLISEMWNQKDGKTEAKSFSCKSLKAVIHGKIVHLLCTGTTTSKCFSTADKMLFGIISTLF